jgi:hypothetical protein
VSLTAFDIDSEGGRAVGVLLLVTRFECWIEAVLQAGLPGLLSLLAL